MKEEKSQILIFSLLYNSFLFFMIARHCSHVQKAVYFSLLLTFPVQPSTSTRISVRLRPTGYATVFSSVSEA